MIVQLLHHDCAIDIHRSFALVLFLNRPCQILIFHLPNTHISSTAYSYFLYRILKSSLSHILFFFFARSKSFYSALFLALQDTGFTVAMIDSSLDIVILATSIEAIRELESDHVAVVAVVL